MWGFAPIIPALGRQGQEADQPGIGCELLPRGQGELVEGGPGVRSEAGPVT